MIYKKLLRDYLAAKAMEKIMDKLTVDYDDNFNYLCDDDLNLTNNGSTVGDQYISMRAYNIADAMLEARNK